MTIAVDISALQGPHRMRGIGFAILNFINNISSADRSNHKFVFFMFKQNETEALELLNLTNMDYEIRYLDPKKPAPEARKSLLSARWRHLLRSASRQLFELKDRYIGNSMVKDCHGIDVFIQPDQSASLPRDRHNIKKVLIIYDIIPYVLEWEYLWSYKTARLRGFSRKASLRCSARRWFYIKKLRVNTRRADILLAISKVTKDDFVRHAGAKARKIKVIHLGVPDQKTAAKEMQLQRYHKSSWGYLAKDFKLNRETPFILYVGGADRRRRIDELITAFNNLRGEGIDLKLVLSGDTMQGPENIATQEIQGALKTSSYLDDIIFTGFTSDEAKNYLYKNCLAFVYPSTYEGFGLPVLEAMNHGCPVICYPNQAVKEVAGDLPIYAQNRDDLYDRIKQLLVMPAKEREAMGSKNVAHAEKFSWSKTAKEIIAAIS